MWREDVPGLQEGTSRRRGPEKASILPRYEHHTRSQDKQIRTSLGLVRERRS